MNFTTKQEKVQKILKAKVERSTVFQHKKKTKQFYGIEDETGKNFTNLKKVS